VGKFLLFADTSHIIINPVAPPDDRVCLLSLDSFYYKKKVILRYLTLVQCTPSAGVTGKRDRPDEFDYTK
jgi:hypothetical protein